MTKVLKSFYSFSPIVVAVTDTSGENPTTRTNGQEFEIIASNDTEFVTRTQREALFVLGKMHYIVQSKQFKKIAFFCHRRYSNIRLIVLRNLFFNNFCCLEGSHLLNMLMENEHAQRILKNTKNHETKLTAICHIGK